MKLEIKKTENKVREITPFTLEITFEKGAEALAFLHRVNMNAGSAFDYAKGHPIINVPIPVIDFFTSFPIYKTLKDELTKQGLI
jgi:hypothetical protein